LTVILSEVEWIRGVKIGKILTKNQSKTLIPSNKNQNFQKFLTTLLTSSYKNLESIFENFFRIKSAGSSNYRGAAFFASGKKMPNTNIENCQYRSRRSGICLTESSLPWTEPINQSQTLT